MDGAIEEIALPLGGKKRKIRREQLLEYYGREKMRLTEKTIQSEIQNNDK